MRKTNVAAAEQEQAPELGASAPCAPFTPPRRVAARAEAFFQAHPRAIPRLQAAMVVFYLLLIVLPPFLPAPGPEATPFTDFVRFAQFAIWSLWWPFVLLSLLVFGRAWCGVLCPEGALAQFASRRARQRTVPRSLTWGGIPLLAFATITAVGQMVEVDEHPLPQLLVLGGSTLCAVTASLVFTRDSRIWCRYLCPVSLLFGVFSRLGAVVFHVEPRRLEKNSTGPAAPKGRCPVLIHLPVMSTARDCIMCFRCAGWRDAIHLRVRRPGEELERIHRAQPMFWEIMFLFGGAIGLPLGVFYAEAAVIEGWLRLASLFAGTASAIVVLSLVTAIAARALGMSHRIGGDWRERFVRLGYSYAPLSLFSLFLGLSQPTFETAVAAGLPHGWVLEIRTVLLLLGFGWSIFLAFRILSLDRVGFLRTAVGFVPLLAGALTVLAAWARVLLWAL